MTTKFDKNLDKTIEIIALNGLISGYELSKKIKIPLSNAQRLLTTLFESGDLEIYSEERRRKKRQKVLYGLSPMGFISSVAIPNVENNFSKIFETFLRYRKDDKNINNELKEKTISELMEPDIVNSYKQFYLAISQSLNELFELESLDNDDVIELAIYLAMLRDPQRMFSIYKRLYPKMPFGKEILDTCLKSMTALFNELKGEKE